MTHAKTWAKNIADARECKHSPDSEFGENVYCQSGGSIPTCDRVVKLWYDEVKDYDYDNPGYSKKTGHFTQVVWKNSTGLGCGCSRNGALTFVICNYSPRGNVIGQFRENVLKPKN